MNLFHRLLHRILPADYHAWSAPSVSFTITHPGELLPWSSHRHRMEPTLLQTCPCGLLRISAFPPGSLPRLHSFLIIHGIPWHTQKGDQGGGRCAARY